MGDGNNLFKVVPYVLPHDMPVWHKKDVTNEYVPKGETVWCIDCNGSRFTYAYHSAKTAEYILAKFVQDRVTTIDLMVNFSSRNPVFVSRQPWETWPAQTRK